MTATSSVSKGVFVFQNDFKTPSKKKPSEVDPRPYAQTLWYDTYNTLWETLTSNIESAEQDCPLYVILNVLSLFLEMSNPWVSCMVAKIVNKYKINDPHNLCLVSLTRLSAECAKLDLTKDLNNNMFSTVLSSLVKYVGSSYSNVVTEIPTAALLTGINMPDQNVQFNTLTKKIRENVTPHIANLHGEKCHNLKYLVENLTNQLVNVTEDSVEVDEDDSDVETFQKIKKSQCSFVSLQGWYNSLYNEDTPKRKRNVIAVIIPDFENFPPRILQDFILVAHSYLNRLPFVFIFGISTSAAFIHRSLPYQVSSKVRIRLFHSPISTVYLNNVLENVFFTKNCPFHLGDKVFNLFTDIFLFYDLSVSGFIQNFKYAMLEHFAHGNAMALCKKKKIKSLVADFTHEDLENARHLYSFRALVEGETAENRIRLLLEDEYFSGVLKVEVRKIQNYLKTFHPFLEALHALVYDLPKSPLGKQVRELYAIAVSGDIVKTPAYIECFQLLGFQSREELCKRLSTVLSLLQKISTEDGMPDVIAQLETYLNSIIAIDLMQNDEDPLEGSEENVITGLMGRVQLREKLLKMSRQSKPLNKYEKLRREILDYLSSQFEKYLLDPKKFHFHEIFFFNDISIKDQLVGSHRAAIHTALTDPQVYLHCSCCEISDDSIILPTMPDISIAYKLHLECGKMINMYDWLQAFLTILDPEDAENDGSKRVVKPELQARFTQAVAELEYLGFIKSSKRKTDHVARLTWGG